MIDKSLIFIKTSNNHSRLLNRFKEVIDKYEYNIKPIELDLIDDVEIPLRKSLLKIFPKRYVLKANKIYKKRFWRVHTFIFFYFIKNKVKKNILNNNAQCIILMDQYIGLRQYIISNISKDLNLPLIMVPFVVQDLNDIIISRYNHERVIRDRKSILGHLVFKFLPEWRVENKESSVLWGNSLEIVMMKILGLKSKNPLIALNEFIDNVLVPSSIHKNRLVKCGFNPEKIISTGDISFDIIYNEKQKKICDNHNNKLLLYSIVPDLKRDMIYGSYENYKESYVEIFEKFKKRGWNVICNPHPSTDLNTIEYFENKGFLIDRNDIAEVLPKADLYLTSYSSTIFWALALGIPTINHDIYDFDYVGYNEFSGVECLDSGLQLIELANQITLDKSKLKKWQNITLRDSEQFGAEFINGNVISNMLKVIKSISAN